MIKIGPRGIGLLSTLFFQIISKQPEKLGHACPFGPTEANGNATETNLTGPIPEITSKNTKEKFNPLPFEQIIDYLNAKTQSNYKAKSKKLRN
jgi:hypothetical protein